MALDITLKIYMPEKKAVDKKVHRVVLPTDGKTLTVIKDRAPTLLFLDMGIVQILDDDDKVTEEYFVANGAVDINNDTCTILTESVINRKELNLNKARELYEEFHNFFYEWLVEFFEKEETFNRKSVKAGV